MIPAGNPGSSGSPKEVLLEVQEVLEVHLEVLEVLEVFGAHVEVKISVCCPYWGYILCEVIEGRIG